MVPSFTLNMQVCEGLYVVEVQLFGYNNPTGTCYDKRCLRNNGRHRCCDTPSGMTSYCIDFRRCDSYFIYCLRPLGSSGQGCSDYVAVESEVNNNDNDLDFSQSMVLGLENPLTLRGLTKKYNSVSGNDEIVVYYGR